MKQLELINISCPLCVKTDYHPLFTRADGLKIVQCNSCHLAYLNPRPNDESIPLLYDSNYFIGGHELHPTGYKYLDDELMNIQNPDFKWKPILKCISKYYHHSPVELIDVGCAIGGFLYLANKMYQWKVMGVEISPFAVEYARSHYHLNVFQGPLKDAKLPDNKFDIVTLFDVIEHDPYPVNLLQEIHRILKPGGLIVILTPNIQQAELYGDHWEGLQISLEHLIYFSTETLTHLLKVTGFTVLHHHSQNIQSSFQKKFSVKPDIDPVEFKQLHLAQKGFWYVKQYFPFLKPLWKLLNSLMTYSTLKRNRGYHIFFIASKINHP